MPDDAELRTCLARCDDLEKKVLGGLVARCIVEPQRVRDGEWLLRAFVEVATVALGAGDAGPATTADVERVQAWVRTHRDLVLRTALRLFLRTADELRAAGSPPTIEAAQAIVRRHLAGSGAP
jgi:hypothetical protein